MLQIITGKFFSSDDLYRTPQRGVLYTNYHTVLPIESGVGRFLPADVGHDVASGIYEVEQKLEAANRDGTPSVLAAVGAHHLLEDFAAVLSFELGAIFTPDVDLVRRLTQSRHPPLGVPRHPRDYVRRVFDVQIQAAPTDPDQVRIFLEELIGLERRAFNAAMRAIRRYVTGLHRVGDDLEIAYTLLVASIESLAQEFDAFDPTWSDLDHRRRNPIDQALDPAPPEIAEAVRAAILAAEHVALGRRFREFTLGHLTPSFFREEAQGESGPARRCDLPKALEQAYQFRSKQVHTLRELPRLLTAVPFHQDTMPLDGKPALTIHGLARVARHVIREFVRRGRKVEQEEFDYRSELPGVVTAPVATRYWIWRREGYSVDTAPRYLTGFLSELTAVLLKQPDAALTDIRDVLEEVERLAPGVNGSRRLPMLSLYFLFHQHLAPSCHRPDWEDFINRFIREFNAPSIESLVTHVLMNQETGWTADDLVRLRAAYFQQRYHRNGLNIGAIFEAAVTLTVAEAYRSAGELDTARSFISEAVSDLPGHDRLMELEKHSMSDDGLDQMIDWTAELLPQDDDAADAGAAEEA